MGKEEVDTGCIIKLATPTCDEGLTPPPPPLPDKLFSLLSTWLTLSFSSFKDQHKCPLVLEAHPSPCHLT